MREKRQLHKRFMALLRNRLILGVFDTIHYAEVGCQIDKEYQVMVADAITHLKYWYRISSSLERTKNSTKTSNTSFERSDSGLSKSWRLEAWHSYWPATPTLYDKLNFLGKGGMASPWCCHAPVLQENYCSLSGLSNEILWVFVPLLLFQ